MPQFPNSDQADGIWTLKKVRRAILGENWPVPPTVSAFWDETVLSIGTSSTNSLNNSTFIDRSTDNRTMTVVSAPTQTAFHPYLDNWSVEFDGSGDYLSVNSIPCCWIR